MDEIKYANNGDSFKTGTLEFQEDIEDELYEELRIDKNKVLKLKDIRDILLNPTKVGLQKIIGIQSLSDFDRVRGQFQKLKYDGYRLTLDIANIIERRTNELFSNQIKTSIIIDDADIPTHNNDKIRELEAKIAEMEALLSKSSSATDKSMQDVKEEIVSEQTVTKRKPGRPANKKTS